MDALWKGLLGDVVTALIVVASKRGNVLPGILPLAPGWRPDGISAWRQPRNWWLRARAGN